MELSTPNPRAARERLNWGNVVFFIVTPIAGLTVPPLYAYHYGLHWSDIAVFLGFFIPISTSISAGYHRYYAHRSYECSRFLQFLYLVIGAGAVQGPVTWWAADHRYHHKYIDTDDDPYNINRGFWWAHMGWLFYYEPRQNRYASIPELMKDRLVIWQDRYYFWLALFMNLALPLGIGFLASRPLEFLLWGGLFRMAVFHQITFCINSWAHYFGTQPYSTENTARDSFLFALASNGEGYHNYHHKFPSDYRNGAFWYQWDPSKWMLWCLSHVGLTWRLHAIPYPAILKAKLEVEVQKMKKEFQHSQDPRWLMIREQFESGFQQLREVMKQYADALARYRCAKKHSAPETLESWQAKLQDYHARFKAAQAEWRQIIAQLRRVPAATA